MTQLRVISSHPTKQVVVYDIAAQLAVRGHLTAHLAAVYYVPTRLPYALAPYVPGEAGRQLRRQLTKRRSGALPDGLVVDWPWVELATRALQQLPGLKRFMIYGGMYATVEAAHDAFAARWIKKHRAVDIVMCYHGSALKTLQATREIGARSVLNVIHPVSPHRLLEAEYKKLGGGGPLPPSQRLLREIEAADYLLTPSALTTDSLLELGIPAARIKEIPYGIDVTDPPNNVRRAAANRVRFLFVGKLSIHKGLHILRQAWSVIAASNVSLTLVGRPIGPLEADLVRTWKDDRVSTVDEIDDINDAYRQADVFVFPSLVEGFGMVTLEAMASGLPVIVTERSKAVVRHGVDGFVLPPGDADALARCMIRLAEDAGLRAELGRNAHERARQYPWERFGSELCDWLNFVAHGHSFQGN